MIGRSACLALCVAVGAIALCVTATTTHRQHIDTALHQHVPSARLSALLKRHAAMDADQPLGAAAIHASRSRGGKVVDGSYRPADKDDSYSDFRIPTKAEREERKREKQKEKQWRECKDDDECTEKGQFCYKHVYSQEFLHTHSVGICKAAGEHWDTGCGKKFAWSEKHPCKAGLKCKRKTYTAWSWVVPFAPSLDVTTRHVCVRPYE
ncbi:unnamed protein product [Vitrella brassicaformis CCMP3155]|uniref:Dickkopf N-terminal cysteine-rich domain-containing protein n=1 Tax=Vitrella brassicaformis (strain CCMP3155) TaxID=1169540 RepID=A0A0G4G4L8_VITBC|nr:unnamed protein product [Vitrella brassicaformis CCMP3155]|eukprot:CEM23212.1 unnamed protein product [Vitrella brassicaformis CCMP3155]